MRAFTKVAQLVTAIVACEGAGIVGSLFTISAINSWYITLNKPIFSPPNWLFGPVWTLLYFLMGVSLYLIWNKRTKINKKIAYKVFFAQLLLNTLWSVLFFGLKNPAAGFVGILLLWYFIFRTIQEFKKISTLSSYLLYPYLAWVSFATLLNLAIVVLN